MTVISKYHLNQEALILEKNQIEAAKKDILAFGPLYEKYYKAIFIYIFHRVTDKEIAFDLTSQVFLKAMTAIKNFEFKGLPFSSWLYRIAYNELAQLFRDQKLSRTISIHDVHLNNLVEEIDTGNYEEYLPEILKIIKFLPEEDLQLMEMRYFENKSFREVSEILMISENNAKVRAHRILEKIKQQIKNKKNQSYGKGN